MTENAVRVWTGGAALVAAPVLVMAATAVDTTGADDMGAYLGQVAGQRGRYLLAGLLLAAGMAAFLPAAAGLARLADRSARGGVLRAGALLLAAGAAVGGEAVASGFAPAYVATAPHAAAVPAAFLDALNTSPWALAGFIGSGLGLGLGFPLIGAGLWRAAAVPRWAAVLCALTPLTFALPGDLPFDALGWLAAVVPFALAARNLIERDVPAAETVLHSA